MANLPTIASTSSHPDRTKLHDSLIEALSRGEQPAAIAKRLAPTDLKKRKRVRAKIWKIIRSDPLFHARVAERARGQVIVDLLPAVGAAGRRASRGRMDAVKFVSEATGFHNPRVRHEHSGEVSIKLEMPRPKFNQDIVADAEVVED